MRICVVGAGAIGGVIAARLAGVDGTDVSVLARGATLSAVREHGLRVSAPDGTVTAQVVAASDDAAELGPQDFVVVAVKAQSMAGVAEAAGGLLGPSTAVLSTLNGVPWWFLDGFGGPAAGHHLDSVDPGGKIAAVLPAARVIGGTVHLSAAAPAPGEVSWRAGNGLIIGELDGAASPRLDALAAVLGAGGFDVTVSARIRDDVWYKLWGNLTLNPICALTNASTGPVLDDDLVRDFVSRAMLEARAIGERIGCPIAQSPQDRHAVTRKLGDFVPSMLQDARAGRPLELDALTGAVRELGTLVGVPTPNVDAIHGLTRLWVSARVLPGTRAGQEAATAPVQSERVRLTARGPPFPRSRGRARPAPLAVIRIADGTEKILDRCTRHDGYSDPRSS
jgi:2-dehydropantoate 2-reductase